MDPYRKKTGTHSSTATNSRKRSLDQRTALRWPASTNACRTAPKSLGAGTPSACSAGRNVRRRVFGGKDLVWLSLGALLLCGFPALAQSQSPLAAGIAESLTDTTGTWTTVPLQLPEPQLPGTIRGRVRDRIGAPIPQARVKILREDASQTQEVVTDDDGQFSFANIAPGPFQLAISSDGFTAQSYFGTMHSGENCIVPPVTLAIAAASAEVQVTMSPVEIAEAEIKDEEKQRVLGVVPNFYVTYDPAAVALRTKQKFELAWKATVDPISFGLTGAIAGIQQATDDFSGYGQGAAGYGKRYGASYADLVTGTFIGSAILPSLLKQDPRYFYNGSGTVRSRILYAIATSVICKGDNGHWQANYSGIAGGLASGAISNLYYPASDHRGAELTVENALIGIGSTAATNLLQEFVIRRLTPHAPSYAPAPPNGR
jgi:Carboxypeptidase regulatory-like domain